MTVSGGHGSMKTYGSGRNKDVCLGFILGKAKLFHQTFIVVIPDTQNILFQMGEQIKLARLRRELPVELGAECVRISCATLWSMEKGFLL